MCVCVHVHKSALLKVMKYLFFLAAFRDYQDFELIKLLCIFVMIFVVWREWVLYEYEPKFCRIL
jgi:hypothetical protein